MTYPGNTQGEIAVHVGTANGCLSTPPVPIVLLQPSGLFSFFHLFVYFLITSFVHSFRMNTWSGS